MKTLDDLQLCAGDAGDYHALAAHHYRGAKPVTITRVLALRHARPSVADRFLSRRGGSQTVAVVVESLPALSCRLRDGATGGRYAAIAPIAQRARVLNAEIRCISRLIVHPQWRGLGLAVRLVKHALATATTPLTEAIAAMGAVHPFFERAGMTAYRAPCRAGDARLIAALAAVGWSELDLAMPSQVVERMKSLEVQERRFIERELTRWFTQTMTRRAAPLDKQLAAARQWLLCEPVYFIAHGGTSKGARDAVDRDPAFTPEAAPAEQQRDAGGAAREAGRAHRSDGAVSAGGGAEDQCGATR